MAGNTMNEISRARFAPLAALLIALLPLACSPGAPPERPPLEGATIGGPFALTDQNGRAVTDASFAGKYRVMYFGYTFCPDVCPIDMQVLGAGLRQFEAKDPARGAKVVPVFITVDPARDTPAVLKEYVKAFHPRMVGLTGSAAAVDKAASAYKVIYRKGETTPGGGYLVEHSRIAYLMDPAGKPLALLPVDENPDAVARELARWTR
ncbi:SCO family protein [Sphingomonas immobilis]|uniref:SCO family protein n=1 Tax=Sphingomonas immobilis TaxID=3063997 RepID=A0ABT8ZUZ2_9SPHN|nr:SCO family protein [Sphingomonas sp. CA1-15]MDO7841393.1 SCO family protein [Sphingomonas sp. CA1-15]